MFFTAISQTVTAYISVGVLKYHIFRRICSGFGNSNTSPFDRLMKCGINPAEYIILLAYICSYPRPHPPMFMGTPVRFTHTVFTWHLVPLRSCLAARTMARRLTLGEEAVRHVSSYRCGVRRPGSQRPGWRAPCRPACHRVSANRPAGGVATAQRETERCCY